ncbi:putative damage-inducible protein DinB [Chitinophaga niastensis]|uniref:Putative damage-inducible protein DinB n=1 Tax=Chitinophaga niastensis TaxID=536980 RepID=A0A2P8HUP6_CHINA|nr:DinB family protein [Chitinophaga niastensis]PSL49922.1 putative damage-inducible protein DinB [Chitinophaga niastensis]
MIQTATPATRSALSDLVKGTAAYNLWANKTMVEWLKSKAPEQFETEVASSFSSIKSTLHHILTCQNWWLDNLQQTNPAFTYGEVYTGSVSDLLEDIVTASAHFADYVMSLSDAELQATCEVPIPFTGDFNIPRFEMVQQMAYHATYHRGQVVTIGRHVGITDATNTDYMYWNLLAR